MIAPEKQNKFIPTNFNLQGEKMKEYKITKNEAGIRIDKIIGELEKEISRTAIQRMIEEGSILVNGKQVKTSYKVSDEDIIIINEGKPKEADLLPQDIPLDIIYEDEDILIINKEKGMVVHPGNGNPDGTLVNAVMAKCKGSLSGIGGKIRPGVVHRIDKDTSGLVIIAKNDKAHINISEQIKNREVKKVYVALVRGVISENEAVINMPIGRSTKDRKKMAVSRNGKEAITEFEVLKRYKDFTYIKLNIKTGRTHQIRVHMSEIGHPVVGDEVYSNGKNPFNVKGQMLHAKELEFIHPTTNKKVKFEAPLPEYFTNILEELDKL